MAPGLSRDHTSAPRAGSGDHLDDATVHQLDRWWRAANYLSVGQIYLRDNPLLREELVPEHVKARLLGHWGTTPGLTFLYAHMNRAIAERALNTIYVTGPGHGGPGLVAASYLEGTYSETYPDIGADADGLRRLFRQFSYPGGIPSHVAPETPGSIHEGGELGYALSHAYGAVFDNPDLLAFTVVGDGEAETGPLATSWHSNKFLSPVTDGVVLPVLHLNGYKIANPTVLARIGQDELADLMRGYGHTPYFFTAGFDDEPIESIHRRFASLLDTVLDAIAQIKADAVQASAEGEEVQRPAWPMIVFRTPKGWTGPKEIDGKKAEGSWRSHQVPLSSARDTEEHLGNLRDWLLGYRPEELFDDAGAVSPDILAAAPTGQLRMSANPHANGGLVLRNLRMPDWQDYAVPVDATLTEAPRVLGEFLRDVIVRNPDNFRIFGPDETASNRLQAVFSVTDKQWNADYTETDESDPMARSGRVMEMLSEHQCQGWLEGYLLTGRHGMLSSYEAFIHLVDSMFNQHAKWLKVTNHIEWRRPIASLNYLLSSHVWRQDHNGFSHQDPGFIDHVVNKKADIIRVYLPPDTNTLLSTYDHILRTKQYVNVVVAGKQPAPTFMSAEEAMLHCTRGLGIWPWAGTETEGVEPDVVLACAGDVPSLEVVSAADLVREHMPELSVRVVNVVDLMRLQDDKEHPHGLSDREFDTIFTSDKPILFAYHGYPWLIHRLTYRRTGHANLHVRGYIEEGTTTTPFDMLMLNKLDRFQLVIDVIDRVPGLSDRHAGLRQRMVDARLRARAYTREHGTDSPEVSAWVRPDVGETATEHGGPAVMSDTGGDND
ncbi:MAG TPA: phosphoketolase family protein [Ornithinimicrobium sp.]|uniref:phosphoketolase family protein n=1 Tax=Ornithinimicrobium sp. TaxID=1977084 RepID=UPI002B4A382A|nr:phosphoketolase family protein [Ornithinimicrobium sp.]HKJ11023.1 phosphoketolase family protein [Ornithinimicrobium sp.]